MAASATPPHKLSFHRHLPAPVRFFGLCFFAGAIAAIYHEWSTNRGGALFGLAFFGVPGVLLSAGAAGALIDVPRRRVRTWWGLHLLVFQLPVFWRTNTLDDFRVVVLTEEQWYRSERGGGSTVFPVYLERWCAELGGPPDAGPAQRVLLVGATRFVDGRAAAERVAKALTLGVLDARDRSYRPPGTLDQPLAERLAGAADLPTARRPAGARSRLVIDERRVQIDIPAPGITAGTWGALGLCCAVGPVLRIVGPVAWVTSAAISLGLVSLVVVFGVLNDLICERIVLDAEALVVQRGVGAPRRAFAIPCRELEELALTSRTQRAFAAIGKGSRVLAARSDRRTVEFGFGLAEDEQRWLLDALRAHLGLPRRPYR